MNKPVNAFVLRQSPSGVSQLESISLPKNVIVNGWSLAGGLIGEKDYSRFREVLRKTCYSKEKSLRKAGYAASTMWRCCSLTGVAFSTSLKLSARLFMTEASLLEMQTVVTDGRLSG